VGKEFSRYDAGKPQTLHEAVLAGWRKMRATDRFWAVREVSFTLLPGQMLGVIGRNGAGKSTLLQLLGGVIINDEGSIERNGRVGGLLKLGGTFHSDLTGRENVRISGVVGGLTRAQVAKRMDTIVHFAEAESFIDTPVRTFSTGMKMRLAFSALIHTDPDILLIDEHLAVGDSTFATKCLNRINQLKNSGCAIVLISHNIEQIEDNCDRAIWLHDGRVMAYGLTDEIVRQYRSGIDPPS
jgi:lipopolysaccharide transport system ATP-binding protein